MCIKSYSVVIKLSNVKNRSKIVNIIVICKINKIIMIGNSGQVG